MEVDIGSQTISTDVAEIFAISKGKHQVNIKCSRAVVNTTGGGQTVTATALIPAKAKVIGVTAEVLETISGASLTSFALGETVVDRWGAAIALTAGTKVTSANYTADPAPAWSASAINVVLDGNSTAVFSAGKIAICVWYFDTSIVAI